MFDTIIKGGTVVDGTGDPAATRDVAITGGRIAEVGKLGGALVNQTIDADGLLVTPGFVDIHTHYDGQMTWDPLLTPSFLHGVTTIVAGNCGVGFAPVRPGSEAWVCGLMAGVEDIPNATLEAGVPFGWETFAEFLDAVDRLPHAIDVGLFVPHGTVRTYVMGERGARNEPATAEDIAAMASIVRQAMAAGAMGTSTSRTPGHRATDGECVPGTYASAEELLGLTGAMRDSGHGLIGWAPAGVLGEDLDAPRREIELMRRLSIETGCTVTFGMSQIEADHEQWRQILTMVDRARAAGARLHPQVACRPTAIHTGWRTVHPFLRHPTYQGLAELPFEEMVARLRDPDIKSRILSESPSSPDLLTGHRTYPPARLYRFTDPPNYEPLPENSIQAMADRLGVSPLSALYDVMLERDGEELVFYAIANYCQGNAEATRGMLQHPGTILGLSDGGAHVRVILDASQTTYMLTHWVRDRTRGERLPLEWAVRKQTAETAQTFGLRDRGTLTPGMKADVNVIDFDHLKLGVPTVVADLPGGAERLMQTAEGYVATLVSGDLVSLNGDDTGARPGRLVRGAQPNPAEANG